MKESNYEVELVQNNSSIGLKMQQTENIEQCYQAAELNSKIFKAKNS